jgi:hypothetical protein
VHTILHLMIHAPIIRGTRFGARIQSGVAQHAHRDGIFSDTALCTNLYGASEVELGLKSCGGCLETRNFSRSVGRLAATCRQIGYQMGVVVGGAPVGLRCIQSQTFICATAGIARRQAGSGTNPSARHSRNQGVNRGWKGC